MVGTPGYFAPEQMMGAEPDFTADLFAVGLVALYLLDGREARLEGRWSSTSPSTAYRPLPQGVPEPLWQVLGQLLQPDPQAPVPYGHRRPQGAGGGGGDAGDGHDGRARKSVEVFDHIGPLPAGFGPNGPVSGGAGTAATDPSATGSFHLPPPQTSAGVPGQPSTPPTPTPTPTPSPTPTPWQGQGQPAQPPVQQGAYGAQGPATRPYSAAGTDRWAGAVGGAVRADAGCCAQPGPVPEGGGHGSGARGDLPGCRYLGLDRRLSEAPGGGRGPGVSRTARDIAAYCQPCGGPCPYPCPWFAFLPSCWSGPCCCGHSGTVLDGAGPLPAGPRP